MADPTIPESWIRRYVDQLLAAAGNLPDGAMKDACLLRAAHAMDIVDAYREYNSGNQSAESRRV